MNAAEAADMGIHQHSAHCEEKTSCDGEGGERVVEGVGVVGPDHHVSL